MLVGTPIKEVSTRLEYEIKPIIAEKIRQYETIFFIFSQTFHDIASKKDETIRVRGKNYLLQEPEYNDVGKIKNILDKFEDRAFIEKIEQLKIKQALTFILVKIVNLIQMSPSSKQHIKKMVKKEPLLSLDLKEWSTTELLAYFPL